MKYSRRLATIFALAAGCALAQQDAPPAPPAPAQAPGPMQEATPVAAPAPAVAPLPPIAPSPRSPQATAPPRPARVVVLGQDNVLRELNLEDREQAQEMQYAARDAAQQARDRAQEIADQAREAAQQTKEQNREIAEQAREAARKAMEDARLNGRLNVQIPPLNLNFDLAQQIAGRGQNFPTRILRNDSSLYGRGQSALDDHKYDQALDAFTEVVARGGPKADGALYWKAYTLNKLGKRDEAVAAIGQLRTSFPTSHWLEDAKALEIEVKQATGKPVSPEAESDDDLKLMALNGLAQTDPARAYPLLDKLLKGPGSPKLKKRAIYVLAVNNSPQSQQLLEQIARGNSNPDLQLTAIQYMLSNKQFPNRNTVLFEIYSSTTDPTVKREIIGALRSNNDGAHLMDIYKNEKDSSLKREAVAGLGDISGNADLWQLYQAETTSEGRLMMLDVMFNNGNTEKLTEVARTDKDPKVRSRAIEVLSSYKALNLGDTLSNLYGSEQDPQVKRTILGQLSSRRNAKALVDVYHKETNFEMKKTILSHLGNMHTAEANELYMEILNK
jgi:TolA-binding protein